MYSLKNKDIGTNYNSSIPQGQYKNDYEFNRWSIRPRNRAEYYMTYLSIKEHLDGVSFTSCLELGPGPGTWTRLLYRANRAAEFDLVDVSEAMHEQFRLEMRESGNVRYQVSDIMKYEPRKAYDLFFSSRAVEYLEDKVAFFTKLATIIAVGGTGIIVTKNPKQGVRKTTEPLHQGQIAMPEMKQYLEQHGFSDIHFYPVVFRIPIISRFTSLLSEYLFEQHINKTIDHTATNRIIESYLVTFKNKG